MINFPSLTWISFSFKDEKILAILDWVVCPPIVALSEQRIGCTAQCPFCGCVCSGGVACQNELTQCQKHRAEIHMPQVSMYCYDHAYIM